MRRIRAALPLLMMAAAAANAEPIPSAIAGEGFGPDPASASEPAPCREPFPARLDHRPEELRAIASRCNDAAIARLFVMRAAHAEAMNSLHLMSQLIRSGRNHDSMRREQCRVYIGLVEALATQRWPRQPQVIHVVNRAYDQSIALAERTILGYDSVVGLPALPR